jgi:tRNA-modifying protein YgfZ
MNPNWQEVIEKNGGKVTAEGLAVFGAAEPELELARIGTVAIPLTDRGLIRASGEEAGLFLQNLLTNDSKSQRFEQAQYNALCTAKGRMLASFLQWRHGQDYLLQLSGDIHAAILKKLGMYVLRSKLTLADASGDFALIGISGPDARNAVSGLGADPEPLMGVAPFANGLVIRLETQRYEVAIPIEAAEAVWSSLKDSAQPVGSHVWRWLDIRAGVPRISARTQEEFVPQMANFELIGGVCFKKGCYPGQEIVARTQYLGKLKRRMYLAHSPEPVAPEVGAHLYGPETAEQSCGMVIDVTGAPGGGYDLLAVIQMSSAEHGEVRLDSLAGPILEFKPLPYTLT